MSKLEATLETQYIENEIQNILENITPSEYKSFKEIEKFRNMIIDKIYSEFMNYEINKSNKEEAKKQLEGHECIEIHELKKKDYIKYFNLKIFYNLKLSTCGAIIDIFDKNIFVRNGIKLNSIKLNKNKPNYFFRKVSDETLVKMKLLDIINDN